MGAVMGGSGQKGGGGIAGAASYVSPPVSPTCRAYVPCTGHNLPAPMPLCDGSRLVSERFFDVARFHASVPGILLHRSCLHACAVCPVSHGRAGVGAGLGDRLRRVDPALDDRLPDDRRRRTTGRMAGRPVERRQDDGRVLPADGSRGCSVGAGRRNDGAGGWTGGAGSWRIDLSSGRHVVDDQERGQSRAGARRHGHLRQSWHRQRRFDRRRPD